MSYLKSWVTHALEKVNLLNNIFRIKTDFIRVHTLELTENQFWDLKITQFIECKV